MVGESQGQGQEHRRQKDGVRDLRVDGKEEKARARTTAKARAAKGKVFRAR